MNQFLSQDEVDALLHGITGGEVETQESGGIDDSGVVTYDLTNQRSRFPRRDRSSARSSSRW